MGYDKGILGSKWKKNNNDGRNYDDDIKELSKEQKKLLLIISSSNCEYEIPALKHQGNVLLKEIRSECRQGKRNPGSCQWYRKVRKRVENVQSCKDPERWKIKKPFVHDKNEKNVSNSEEVYKIIKDHFKRQFYEESIESLPLFTGQQKKLYKPVTIAEVRQAILKLNNNRAAGPDRISADLVSKYLLVKKYLL